MTPVIRLVDACRTFPGPPPVQALHPVNLTVEPGTYLTVVGPSGSGKSTLLNILGLLDRPSAGVYEFEGADVSELNDRSRTAIRAHQVGFVFQSFHLMPLRTATENVALAQLYAGAGRRQRMLDAGIALERVGLGHRRSSLSNTMSGGERQRVAIARAIVHRPSLLLCDEPTGNLDTATADGVLDLLDELHRDGMTLVVITHASEVAARGQRTVTIRDGRLS
ncbi:ABC transporter ATP-binding protein [Micromonospora sp. C31]|uniref:ABC transporter ATP-binding protein n=1 Tax=Micromonospora sp. C31 TaxID=2824876 RepID=UPI001B38F208|nr:ABC transporter ATP-binding protein [Micromonospora sp. C31]MBQ1072179.1 ABC transporter ATP-binding protein [Micromonospora sp. C31]